MTREFTDLDALPAPTAKLFEQLDAQFHSGDDLFDERALARAEAYLQSWSRTIAAHRAMLLEMASEVAAEAAANESVRSPLRNSRPVTLTS